MKLLTNKQKESYENAKICYISNKKFETKIFKGKSIDYCHYTG